MYVSIYLNLLEETCMPNSRLSPLPKLLYVFNRLFCIFYFERFLVTFFLSFKLFLIILGQSPRYIVTTEWISAVLTRFLCKSPTFSHSYRARNIFARFIRKSPTFGHSYSSRNFWQYLYAKTLLLVISTELDIFWQDLYGKALLLVILTELEIFWQYLYRKALLLDIPTKLEIFWQ